MVETDVAAEHKVPCRVGFCVFQLDRGIGNVHKDDGVVLVGFNLERKAVLCKRNLQVIFRAVFRLIELEARRVQAYAAVFDRAVLLMTSFPLLLFHVAVTEGESIAAPPVKVNSVPFLLS